MTSDMEFAYRAEAWHEMFAVIAVVAATLAGLLFVGLSMNVRTIVGSPVHLARAREAFLTLLVVLILSIFGLIPDQGRVALGIELLVLCILVLGVSLRLQWNTLLRLPAPLRRSWGMRLFVVNGATLAIGIAGWGLVTRGHGGLVWLVPSILICLLWSTFNAWNLVIHATDPSA